MQADSDFDREREIFLNALERSSTVERAAFLDGACGGDKALRRRLEDLLSNHADDSFLEASSSEPTQATANAMLEAPGTVIGRYKLLQKLGEGGCGVVYMAEQSEPVKRRVALKVIKLGMDTRSVIARFEAERQALALMDHPNIAKVLEAGATDAGRPYFVMELVRGTKITDYCDEAQLPTRERLSLFIKVCQAVQHAHQKGIIHRDIKPSNILVTLHDGVPVPKVIDFGIAKATTDQRLTDKTLFTALEQFIGTPAYMSPEQAELSGLDIDTRSDIYSLGVLLYELLVGRTPFDAKELLASGWDTMRKTIREKEPMRPSTRLRTMLEADRSTTAQRRDIEAPKLIHLLRGDVDWIVMKCLEKDRTRRYETANGLAADLKRHLNNEPVVARPPSTAYRFQKAFRRNKLVFAAAAAVSLALVGGIIVSSWLAVRALRAEDEAVKSRQVANESRDQERLARQRADENARQLEQSLYLNNMSLAHWNLTHEPPNIVEAEQLLESCKPELRGWEWDYLKQQWLVEPYVLRNLGQQGVNSLSFSADDRYLASAGADGRVTVWEVATRKAIRSFVAHTNGFAFCVAFDPSDATRLVSAGMDNQVKLRDWSTTSVLHSWPIQYGFQWGMAYAVAFSPDGQRVAACIGKGMVSVWNAATGKEVFSVTHRGDGAESPLLAVCSLAFSRDGQRLATGGADGIVCVWDARSGQRIKSLGRPTNPISGIVFTKDGRRLTAASFDYSGRVFDVESGTLLWRWRAHSGSLWCLALSPDNKRLVTGAEDRTLKLWAMNWAEQTSREVLTFRDFTKSVQCAAFSHDGHRLAACSADGTVRIWDATPRTPDNRECLLTVNQGMEVRTIALRPDGLWLASGGERLPDEQGGMAPVFIWNSRTGQRLTTLSRESLYLFSTAFGPNGRHLAATGDDRDQRRGYTVQIWDLATGSPSSHAEPFPGQDFVYSLSYSPDGRHLVGGAEDGKILVWDAASGKTNAIIGRHSGAVFHLVFSPDGRYLASAAQSGQARVWDGTRLDVLQTNAVEIATVISEISDTLAFSHDSRRLVVASDDQVATVWDIEHRTNVLRLNSDSIHGFRAVAFSPDGRWIASGGTDCRVKLWDARGGQLLHTYRGHKGEVLTMAFLVLPDGPRLISGSRDGTIKYWNLDPWQARAPQRQE